MIDVERARQLQQAGLHWQPAENDHFAITATGIDDQVFVVSQFTALVQMLRGEPAITFHGVVEWALDYVLLRDTVWLPSETQLREELETRLPAHGAGQLRLEHTYAGYCCSLGAPDNCLEFQANNAIEAYSQALLYLLKHGAGEPDACDEAKR